MKQLLLSKLPALFAALAAEQKLYIPADDAAGQANFTLWREGLQLTKKLNTVRSAKDLFFPQVENLVGFRVTGKQLDLVETRDPAEPFVLFGVRACDARSFAILDRVFLSPFDEPATPADLAPFGFSATGRMRIVSLSSDRLVLQSDAARLTFRKY